MGRKGIKKALATNPIASMVNKINKDDVFDANSVSGISMMKIVMVYARAGVISNVNTFHHLVSTKLLLNFRASRSFLSSNTTAYI